MCKCKYCGSEFTKTHNRQMYCCNQCRIEARREQQASYNREYRRKYRKVMPESTIYGLGSGRLGKHTCYTKDYSWKQEYNKIQNEKIFLKIKPKKGVKT